MHKLSPVTLPESAEGETKVSGRTGYRTSDLWLLSQTLSLMVYAKFQYCFINVLFCEPTEICEYNRKLYMYRVPEFRTMLTFTNYGPLKRSAEQTWLTEFESHWRRNSPYRKRCTNARKNFIIVLIICIFVLTFLEPLIHDSKYGDKR